MVAGRGTQMPLACHARAPRTLLLRARRATTVSRATTPGGGSGVADKPTMDVDVSKLNRLLKQKPPLYRVLLHNDNTNRREYVVKTLLKVIDGMTVDIAVNIMQEAHTNGIGLVATVAQDTAEQYVAGLRRNGLTSTLEPDS